MPPRRYPKAGQLASAHEFAFSGLMACSKCGCSIVGEIKKQRYVYYHCTGYTGKCPEPYAQEEVLSGQFADAGRRSAAGRECGY